MLPRRFQAHRPRLWVNDTCWVPLRPILRNEPRHVPILSGLTPNEFDQALIAHEAALIASLKAHHWFASQFLAKEYD